MYPVPSIDSLVSSIIEKLPDNFDLIVRTNNDPDKRSGCPKSAGFWMVHLMKYLPETEDDVSMIGKDSFSKHWETVYLNYGNNLYALLEATSAALENELLVIINPEFKTSYI